MEMRGTQFTYVLVLLLFVLNTSAVFAQTTKIRGKVMDAETKEVLAFVNVAFKGSSIGTVTDFNGEFILETRNATDSLSFSYIGYTSKSLAVRKGAYQEFNVELLPSTLAIQEVVVKPGENPAHPILRNIIANKKKHNISRLNSYQVEVYNKLELDINNFEDDFKDKKIFNQFQFVFNYADTSALSGKVYLPVFISETVSDFYYNKNPKYAKEIVKASKMSGVDNESVSQFAGKLYQDVNIYDNFMAVFDPGFISPIADFGLRTYKYYLIDSSYRENNWCYHITFKPKRKQERTFSGDFWVADTSFAVKSIKMRMSPDVNMNYVNDVLIEKEFSQTADSVWMLEKESMMVDFNITDKTTGFFGKKTTNYSNYIIDKEIPEAIESLKTNTLVQEDALLKVDDYWVEARPFELTEKETKIYEMVDSVKNVPVFRTFMDVINLFVNYYYVVGKFEIGPYYKMYSFNEIEGNRFRVSGRTSNAFSTKWMFNGMMAYGDKDDRFKFGVGALYVPKKNPRTSLEVSYKKDVEQLGQSPNALTEDNFMTSFLRRNPNYKLTMVQDFSAHYEKEWYQGLSNKISYSWREILPTKYIPFQEVGSGADLSRIVTSEFRLNTRIAKDEKFLLGEFERVSLGSENPIVNIDLAAGVKGFLGGQYNYAKLDFSVIDKVAINPFGEFYYYLQGGKVFGEVPYPLLKLHEGNETYAFDQYAYNMMNYYEFASDQYLSLSLEHHFNGFFLNHIPLIRKLQWREVVSSKAIVGSISDKNKSVLAFPAGMEEVTKPYYEASLGIENIFKIIRVDAMWRLSHRDNPNIQNFSVRVKLQFIL
jgi:hypothetical protein